MVIEMSRIEKEINVILLIKKGKKYKYFLFHFFDNTRSGIVFINLSCIS